MVAALKHRKLVADKVSRVTLRENGVLPVSKMTKAPLPGVLNSSKGLLQEEGNLLMARTSEGFNPDAFKLMKESGHNFSKSPSPGHVIDTKPDERNDAQKMVQKQGDEIVTLRIGHGYMPPQLVKISR